MYPKKIILILILFLTVGTNASAQGFFKDKFLRGDHIELGIHTGPSLYIGELNDNLIGFNQINPFNSSWNVGASLKQYFASTSVGDRTWGIRLDYNFTQINGTGPEPNAPTNSDPDQHLRFSNHMHELALLGEFQFWEFRPTRERTLITPYVLAGVGWMYHHAKAANSNGTAHSLNNQLVEIKKPVYIKDSLGNNVLKGAKHNNWAGTIPFGAGIKYNFSGPLTLALELNYRYTFSDFLDGIASGLYLDYNHISNNLPQGATKLTQTDWETLVSPSTQGGTNSYIDLIGRPRGHKGNDFFMTTVFKATWTFYKYRDPSWK